jgi:hypothetical protein
MASSSPGGYMTPSKRENFDDDDASFQVFFFYNILSDHDELSRPFFSSSSSFQPRFPLKRDARRGLQ